MCSLGTLTGRVQSSMGFMKLVCLCNQCIVSFRVGESHERVSCADGVIVYTYISKYIPCMVNCDLVLVIYPCDGSDGGNCVEERGERDIQCLASSTQSSSRALKLGKQVLSFNWLNYRSGFERLPTSLFFNALASISVLFLARLTVHDAGTFAGEGSVRYSFQRQLIFAALFVVVGIVSCLSVLQSFIEQYQVKFDSNAHNAAFDNNMETLQRLAGLVGKFVVGRMSCDV